MTGEAHLPRAALCDFGLAWLVDDPDFKLLETNSTFRGSTRWCSPEYLLDGRRGLEGDVWAWAWLVWEVGDTLFFSDLIRY